MQVLTKAIMPAFALALSIMFAAFVAVMNTNAQSSDATQSQSARWLVSCNNRADPKVLNCAMAQSIFQNQPRQHIMTANIFKDTSGALTMRLQLPHGLDLTSGVNIVIDEGKAVKHPISTADANGAYTRIDLDDAMLAAMKAGNLLSVGVSGANGKAINLQLSLSGFSDAHDLMIR